MFNFFKRKKNYPPFEDLKNFAKQHYYFSRIAEWDWLNKESICVTDPNNPRVFTFDPWPQIVFLNANGQKTVSEFIYSMADKYSNEIPNELDSTIIKELQTLVGYRIIEYSEVKGKINPLYNEPKSKNIQTKN